MRFESITAWLSWLESCHPTEIDLGLARIQQVYKRLGLEFKKTKVVTVAGTNGKGSCIAVMQQLLLGGGYRVGAYTSPHLLHYNERIVVNGQPVDELMLLTAFDAVEKCLEDTSLSYFEFGTLAALVVFSWSDLDVILLEVGLGGRLDAVNIIDPDIAIVTSIDLDHQDWLGDTRELIAEEKAGIFRKGIPAICADPRPPAAIERRAKQCGAKLYQLSRDFRILPGDAGRWSWQGYTEQGELSALPDLPAPQLPVFSVAAAIQALHLLPLPVDQTIYQGIDHIYLAGRFQTLQKEGVEWVFDVAHNPAAAGLLAQRLQEQATRGKTHALFAAMADKDITGMVVPLKTVIDHWHIMGLDNVARSSATKDLQGFLEEAGVQQITAYSAVSQACAALDEQLMKGDRVIVFGSFYTVAAVMAIMQVENSNAGVINE